MIKKLEALLNEAAAIQARADEATSQIAKIVAQKDEVVATAAGPDDEKALNKLNVLVSQEQIANSQLKISKREIAGIQCRLLNEAGHVRKEALFMLQNEQRRLLDRLDAKLEEFYPVARERKQVIEHLYAGSGVLQVPALYEIGRRLAGLAEMTFNSREATEIKWANNVLSSASNALALLEAK